MSLVTQRMEEHAAVLEATKALIPDIEKAGALIKEALASATKSSFAAMAAAPPTRSTWLLKSSVVFRKNGRPSGNCLDRRHVDF